MTVKPMGDKSSLSISTSTSATMIGFSATIITLILTLVKNMDEFGIQMVILFYVLTIIQNFSSVEFLTLASWDEKNYSKWTALGGFFYGSGKVFLMISISLTCLVIMNFFLLSLLVIILYICGESFYYWLRLRNTDEEPNIIRTIGRIIVFLEMALGLSLLFWIK